MQTITLSERPPRPCSAGNKSTIKHYWRGEAGGVIGWTKAAAAKRFAGDVRWQWCHILATRHSCGKHRPGPKPTLPSPGSIVGLRR